MSNKQVDLPSTITGHSDAMRHNIAIMLDALERAGGGEATLRFAGSGGDVWDWEPDLTAEDKSSIATLHVYTHLDQDEDAEFFSLSEVDFDAAMDAIGKQVLAVYGDDLFELDEGGGGELVISTDTSKATLSIYENEADQENAQPVSYRNSLQSIFNQNVQCHSDIPGIINKNQATEFNINSLMSAIKKSGGTYCELTYDGSGDSGNAWEISTDAQTRRRHVEVIESTSTYASGSFITTLRKIEVPFSKALDCVFYDVIDANHGGYENNEGGGGTVRADVVDGSIKWSGYHNVINQNYSDPIEIEPAEILSLQKSGETPSKPRASRL